jgi:hypothetical protein
LGRPQFNLLAVAAASWWEVIETHAERREKAKYMKNCQHSLLPVQFECSPQKLQQPCHHIQEQVRTISLVCNLPLYVSGDGNWEKPAMLEIFLYKKNSVIYIQKEGLY